MGNIRLIGPRSSGKTTYLAGLAYWPDKQSQSRKSSHFKVEAIGDAKELTKKAEDIILQGAFLEQTNIAGGIYEAPLYQFNIQLKRFLRKPEIIDLVVRDYPGEIFDDLADGSSNPLHEEFLEECFMKDVVGCLILLTEWTKGADQFYAGVLDKFLELMDLKGRLNDLRLAVAMSKCERGELWSGRLDPEFDIFGRHLPRTKHILKSKIPPHNLQFYAISTFGVLKRNDPRPNRKDKDISGHVRRKAVLREPNRWRPYNMIEPLYWLSKGKRLGL